MNQDTDHIKQNPNNISYKMYTCAFCNYKSERIWCITRHIKAHHKHPIFKCKHCDYQSNRRLNLNNMRKIYMDIKNLQITMLTVATKMLMENK